MPTDKQCAFYQRLCRQHPTLATEFPGADTFRTLSGREASATISRLLAECKSRYRFSPGSRRAQIADTLDAVGGNTGQAFAALAPRLTDPVFDFAFTRNPTAAEKRAGITSRQALSLPDQRDALRRTIEAVAEGKAWGTRSNGSTPSNPVPALPDVPDIPADTPDPDDAPAPMPAPIIPPLRIHPFLEKIREIRAIEESRSKAEGKTTAMLTTVSGMRPAEYGARMLRQGIPMESALSALTMHWPDDAKRRYGISGDPDYGMLRDPAEVEAEIADYLKTRPAIKRHFHRELPYLQRLRLAGVPAALYGPAGTGKSRLAKDLADSVDMEFGMCPMTGGATPSWLTGAFTLDGWKTRPFVEIYRNGGVFLFDEMDAADPNMLLLVNSALANGHFFNPMNGETIPKHRNFYPIAAMNTLGLGQNSAFKGRFGLDNATLDRFNMGRVHLTLDENLESAVFDANLKGE